MYVAIEVPSLDGNFIWIMISDQLIISSKYSEREDLEWKIRTLVRKQQL